MHIAIVNQWYPPDYGGVAVYNGAMARAYAELGHQVTVITAEMEAETLLCSSEAGITVHRVTRWVEPYAARRVPVVGRHIRTLRHLLYSWRVSALLTRLVRSQNIDVVEFAEVNAEAFWSVLGRQTVPVVVRCHTPSFLLRRTTSHDVGFDMRLMEPIEALCIRRAATLTAPSHDLATRIEDELGLKAGRIAVVPNAIDVNEFTPAPRYADRSQSQPVTILYVGRLGREKGVFVLGDALARLAFKGANGSGIVTRDWRVVFAGADRSEMGVSNRARLERFFSDHGLSDRVEFRGYLQQEELIALYRSCDLCVVPSILYESFSYTCLQAMACGKPVLATTMGGIPEVVVDGEVGILVPPDDVDALTSEMARLVDDASLRQQLGRSGRERVVRLYAAKSVAQQNLALYAETVTDRASR